MKFFFSLSAAVAAALISVGCQTMKVGVPQDVVILSFPTESSVYINGEAVGITPLTVSLPRKSTHEVRLERVGYNPAVQYFSPKENERGMALITFGLMRDLGYYVDLAPNPMDARLNTDLLPEARGSDPFERMAQSVLAADDRLRRGEITPVEHRYITEQILAFFE